jgi:hypothetical protein
MLHWVKKQERSTMYRKTIYDEKLLSPAEFEQEEPGFAVLQMVEAAVELLASRLVLAMAS